MKCIYRLSVEAFSYTKKSSNQMEWKVLKSNDNWILEPLLKFSWSRHLLNSFILNGWWWECEQQTLVCKTLCNSRREVDSIQRSEFNAIWRGKIISLSPLMSHIKQYETEFFMWMTRIFFIKNIIPIANWNSSILLFKF